MRVAVSVRIASDALWGPRPEGRPEWETQRRRERGGTQREVWTNPSPRSPTPTLPARRATGEVCGRVTASGDTLSPGHLAR
jgi:hypothetical protein